MSKGGTGQRVNEWGWSLGGTRGVGWGFTSTEPGGLLHPNDLITEWDHTGARLGPLAFVSHHEEVKVMECSVSYMSKKYFWTSRSMNVSCHFTKLTVNISHQRWVCIKWYINMYFSCTGKSHDILSIWWLITWSYTKMTLNCILVRYNSMLLHVIYIPQCI